ncbi:hydantoinase B/oxoprolinase family protein [Azospirillum picis]|uniref:N-methylhydantoinase B n=1 Tax=Azospirillum picis TaxID=488438 RepID=A0ABU0MHR2_9PROT|nr:hydantoinase B/oxoprolinase family protein [Azospirillum picis]MBP2298817.1 N-methylhydantoinase B [Azospirillum picis]MDQ0532941.1 N-methylhydantoinase B [Azospirillum picis]
MTAQHDTPDAITLEVVRNKLDGIANEMQSTLLRSSFSSIVKEGLDASACLFTVRGESLAQAIAIPIHLVTLAPIMKKFLDVFPIDSIRPGDIFIMNDPYLGGTHLPDLALAYPVFRGDEIVGFSAAMTHHQDVGGKSPGSVPTDATEIFQEGIRIPPLRLRDGGTLNDTLIQVLLRNVRVPEIFMGDLNAQIAACTVGARRVLDLCDAYPKLDMQTVFDVLLDRSEEMTRQALRRVPPGVYRYTDYLDNDGIDLDTPVRIEVTVTLKDGEFICDFTGSSKQVKGPFNCVPSGALAAAGFAIRTLTDPRIPTNGGCFRPIRLVLPEGSIVNPKEPAPVNARTATIKRITGAILACFKDVLPEKVPADSGGELLFVSFGGARGDGTRYVVGDLIAGGSGASALGDGVDVIETDATNCMNLPVEALELEAPIRVRQVRVRRDSGGAGRFRGGLGTVREYEVLEGEAVLTHRGERHLTPAKGSQGGGDGALARSTIHRADGTVEVIRSKLMTQLKAGDRLVVETAGGGGYGAPDQREAAKVGEDVRNGKISEGSAKEQYGKVHHGIGA